MFPEAVGEDFESYIRKGNGAPIAHSSGEQSPTAGTCLS